jgi:DNA-binding NarL/FixJ family response regulator
MVLDAVGRATPQDAPTFSRLEQARGLARSAVAETRRLAWSLRTATVNLELAPAIVEAEVAKLRQRMDLRPDVSIEGEERRVAPEIGSLLQRVLRVVIDNIVVHTHATVVRVLLAYHPEMLVVRVEDDGRGFDPQALTLQGSSMTGLGGVAERARQLGGTLRVESSVDSGTSVQVELPYTPTSVNRAGRIPPRQEPVPEAVAGGAPRIRTVIIDDHTMVREGLIHMLQDQPDLEVVGEAATGSDGLRLITELQPDVVLCDLQLPDLSGTEVISRVHAHFPEIRCLVVTTYDSDEFIYESMKAGAKGYVLKDVSAQELGDAVRAAARNESLLQPVVARKLVERFGELARQGGLVEPLTEREIDVLRSVASGQRNKEIAFELGLSESTIKTHLASIFGKLSVTTRTEAVARGRELGIIAL